MKPMSHPSPPLLLPWHQLSSNSCSRGRVIRFTNALLCTDGVLATEPSDLWVRDGRVIDPAGRFWEAVTFGEHSCDLVVDCEGHILSPGFIDLQFNGAWGVDYSDPSTSEAEIMDVAAKLLQTGVTSFLPTLVSVSAETYQAVLPRFQRLRERLGQASDALVHAASTSAGAEAAPGPAAAQGLPRAAARMLGLHLEGPFMCREKKGAHPERHLRHPLPLPSDPEAQGPYATPLAALERVYGPLDWRSGLVRLITLAPELNGGLAACRALADAGVLVSLGHTSAGIEVADAAVEAGACLVTHLFNAMNTFLHREPGVVGLLGRRPRGEKSLELLDGHWEGTTHGNVYGGGGSGSGSGSGSGRVLGSGVLASPLPDKPQRVGSGSKGGGGGSSSGGSLNLGTVAAAAAILMSDEPVTAFTQVPYPGPGSRSHAFGYAAAAAAAQATAAAAAAAAASAVSSVGAASFYSQARRPQPAAAGAAGSGSKAASAPAPIRVALPPTTSRSAAHSPTSSPTASSLLPTSDLSDSAQAQAGSSSSRHPSAAVHSAVAANGGVGEVVMACGTPLTPSGSSQRAAVLVNTARAELENARAAAAVAGAAATAAPLQPIRALRFGEAEAEGEGEGTGGDSSTPLPSTSTSTSTSTFRPYARPCASVVSPSDPQRAVASCRPFYSLIADGVHVHPYAVSLAYETHPSGLCLVTDAMTAMGLPPGQHTLGDLRVCVLNAPPTHSHKYKGLHAVLVDAATGGPSETLAGAVVPLDVCLNNFITFTGASVPAALAAVTSHPAAALGVGGGAPLGSLRKGAWADLVLLRRGGAGQAPAHLEVVQTWVGGTLGFTKGDKL